MAISLSLVGGELFYPRNGHLHNPFYTLQRGVDSGKLRNFPAPCKITLANPDVNHNPEKIRNFIPREQNSFVLPFQFLNRIAPEYSIASQKDPEISYQSSPSAPTHKATRCRDPNNKKARPFQAGLFCM